MKFDVEINDACELVIDTDYLLRYVTSTQHDLAVQSLSCRDDVIRNVMTQVFEGYTEDGYAGARSANAEYEPYTPLDIFRRKIAKCAGDIAKHQIERLEIALKDATIKYDELVDRTTDTFGL